MKIASWNINSVRARLDRLLDYLKTRQPDVLCLQELKCTDDQFPREPIEALGYHAAVFGQKTYNGVAILSRTPPEDVVRNMVDGGDADAQSRLVAARVGGVNVVCIYAPNGQSVDSPAYQYKLEWYARLSRWLAARSDRSRTVLCGDFNIAPADIDVFDPALWAGQVLASPPEREALKVLMDANGLADVFREKHPEPGRYSWWDYRQLAFPKNRGLRIDYLLLDAELKGACTAADIDREARKGKLPSDHAPVWAELAV